MTIVNGVRFFIRVHLTCRRFRFHTESSVIAPSDIRDNDRLLDRIINPL
jgi:hypothetical protein